MALVKPDSARIAKIKVIGVGGGGSNAVASMVDNANIKGADFIAVNTDAQVLLSNKAATKIQIGEKLTKGLGVGGDPEIGRQAAEESLEKIKEHLIDVDMVFVTAGMGGGCLRGSSLVYTNPEGPVRIDKIKKGSHVYSIDGDKLVKKRVIKAMKTGVKKVLQVKTKNNSLVASYDHPFLEVVPINPDSKGRFINYEFAWKKANELKLNDLVVTLRKTGETNESIKIKGLPGEFKFTSDFCRLYGFLLGDGWLSKSVDSWKIHFSPSEKDYLNIRYLKLLQSVLGLKMKKTTGATWYYANSKSVYNLLEVLGLHKTAKEKEVPYWIFNLSEKCKKEFILGLADADGCYLRQFKENGREKFELRFEMASEKLICQLKVLCNVLGLRTSNISTRTRLLQPPGSPKPINVTSWSLRIYKLYELDKSFEENTRSRKGAGFVYGYRGKADSEFFEYFGFSAIKSIKDLGEEDVYDITVDGSHNFISEGFVVHNSGTGASPVVAKLAREAGALTVGVVTKPFAFEGTRRTITAEEGIEKLRDEVDTLIVIPNQRLMDIIDKKMTLKEAFGVVDSVLEHAVGGIAEIITTPGLINVDFADVKAIMKDAGTALLGIGVGVGDNRAAMAARAAISSPLLDMSIEGAKGILFNIRGGNDLTMFEVDEAARLISTESGADPDANIIFGAVIDENMTDQVRITVIATEVDETRSKLGRMSVIPPKPLTSDSGLVGQSPLNPQPTVNNDNKDDDSESSDQESDKESEFDIPAFLRNPLNKIN